MTECKTGSRMRTAGYILPLMLLLLAFAPLLVSTARGAGSSFTRDESAALLEYAKGCLVAQLDGAPPPSPPEFATRVQRPCFVTFFINKRVFACFGGFTPRKGNLAEEIADNVRMALKNDARSRNLSREKALAAGVQVTLPLGHPRRVSSYSSIDPVSEGMFVEGATSGVAFVPGEAKTAAWAFREALHRLGERDPSAVTLYRFKAEAVSTRLISRSD